MAILGSDPNRYAEYEREIAEEYRAVPPDLYRSGRAHFLRGVLAKPRIFLSDWFEARLEHRARANLEAALAALEAPR